MFKQLGSLFLFTLFSFVTYAQNLEVVNIKIISENEAQNDDLSSFENSVKEEINILMANRKKVVFQTEYCNCEAAEINTLLTTAFNDPEIDIIIALGAMTSAVLAQQTSFPKPAIASIIIDNELQNVPITAQGTSGIDNLSYIQSPFSFEKDLKVLYQMYPFKNIGVITTPDLNNIFPNFQDLFRNAAVGLNTQFTQVSVGKDANSSLALIPDEVDAVYVFPLFDEFDDAEYAVFFEGIAAKKLPSVALLGEAMVTQGALVGYFSEANIAKMPRRIALNVSKILSGINASELPVLINTFSETPIINMKTARKVGAYPDWDLAAEAILLNANEIDTDRSLSLQTAILEALDKNLSLKVAGIDPLLAEKDIETAQSEWLPQLDVNTSLALLDPTSATNSFGTKGRVNWMAGSALSQLVYAEPALANVAIQKLLQKGEAAGLKTTQLDVVIDAATSYLNVLQAKSFMEVQTANVSVTKNNLDIAKAKDAVGYSGATDLNRWKAELALDKIDLNDAQAQLQQAKFSMNQFLNHPIKEAFKVENIGLDNGLLMVTDIRMIDRIHNEKELEQLADFLVKEALAQLPELQQIDYGLAAQERLLKSQKRAFYLPTVGFSGNWDYTINRWEAKPTPPNTVLPELRPTWNLGLGVQYPILQGGQRRINQQITELNILQIKTQKADVRNQLELRVRATLQQAAASYFSVTQYQEASQASNENFKIVQDSYSQGLVSVTNLVDAQNAKVQTELGLVNATYQFIIDFLEVERAIGFYYQLSSPSQQAAFFDRLNVHMLQK